METGKPMHEKTVRQRGLVDFCDILDERRETSDFLWASRAWNPKSVYNSFRRLSPNDIKANVLTSHAVLQTISKFREITLQPINELNNAVIHVLDEIGFERKVSVLRWLAYFTSKLLKKLYLGVLVNERKFLQIKSNFGNNPVLFLPTHRSYADFIIMSYILFHFEVDIPRIAAGIDFMSMKFVAKILRSACAFFMRRSFSLDVLYFTVFSEYVQTLVREGDSSIEFFIEGTRSRTAKSLVPKYGFLNMALKSYFTGLVPDITIIPVSLSYDRVLEEILFVNELLGVPKPKESTTGLYKALVELVANKYGNIFVHFGEPLSLRDYLGNDIDRSIHNFGPVELQDLTPEESKHVVSLAHNIIHLQQELTIITCFNLVAMVINNHVMESSVPLTFHDLVFEVEWLLPIMRALNSVVAVSDDAVQNLKTALEEHKNLVHITPENHIKLHVFPSCVDKVDKSKIKGHMLMEKTVNYSIALLLIQYYSNPCAHFLVNLAFVVLIVDCVKNKSLSKDEIYSHFRFLRSVFANEFVLSPVTEEKDFNSALNFSINQKALYQSGIDIIPGENRKLRRFCRNLFRCYIPSYLILIDVILKEPNSIFRQTSIEKPYQESVEKLIQTDYIHPACLSLDLVTNALQCFVSMGALVKIKRNNVIVYKVCHNQLQKISDYLSIFDYNYETKVDPRHHLSIISKGKL